MFAALLTSSGRQCFCLRADARSNRKSVYYITGNGRKGAGLENRGVLYAFSSNRIGPDRGG